MLPTPVDCWAGSWCGEAGSATREPDFTRGRHLYQVAHAREGLGFVGYCDGRQVAAGTVKAEVMKALLAGAGAA